MVLCNGLFLKIFKFYLREGDRGSMRVNREGMEGEGHVDSAPGMEPDVGPEPRP